MAEIVQAPRAAAAAPPAVANAPSGETDPLLDALIKYITSGNDAQPVSVNHLQDLIGNYTSAPGGRAYLENIAGSSNVVEPPPIKSFEHESPAYGFISSNSTILTATFSAPKAEANFRGTGRGLFPPQGVLEFNDAIFYWNGSTSVTGDVQMKVVSYDNLSMILVTFINPIFEEFAQLYIRNANYILPPGGVLGGGRFIHFGPQQ